MTPEEHFCFTTSSLDTTEPSVSLCWQSWAPVHCLPSSFSLQFFSDESQFSVLSLFLSPPSPPKACSYSSFVVTAIYNAWVNHILSFVLLIEIWAAPTNNTQHDSCEGFLKALTSRISGSQAMDILSAVI